MPDISSLTIRPGLTHCRTCSSRLVNPVYRSATDTTQDVGTNASRFCYEIIERMNDLPAYPEHLTLKINPKSREIHLVSRCTRAGGSWSTTDILTRPGDNQEPWIWDELAKVEENDEAQHVNQEEAGGAAVQAKIKMTEFELSRPKWVHKVPRPVHAIVLHKTAMGKKGDEFDVELGFDERR